MGTDEALKTPKSPPESLDGWKTRNSRMDGKPGIPGLSLIFSRRQNSKNSKKHQRHSRNIPRIPRNVSDSPSSWNSSGNEASEIWEEPKFQLGFSSEPSCPSFSSSSAWEKQGEVDFWENLRNLEIPNPKYPSSCRDPVSFWFPTNSNLVFCGI